MFIHISLLIGAILSILVLIVSVAYLIMQNRNTKSALDASHSLYDKVTKELNDSITENISTIYNQQKTIVELELLAGKWETEYLLAKEVIGAYQYSDEQHYNSKQALLPDMQSDSVTMFNLIDYLRKYSNVFTASELLDEWDKNQIERTTNFLID